MQLSDTGTWHSRPLVFSILVVFCVVLDLVFVELITCILRACSFTTSDSGPMILSTPITGRWTGSRQYAKISTTPRYHRQLLNRHTKRFRLFLHIPPWGPVTYCNCVRWESWPPRERADLWCEPNGQTVWRIQTRWCVDLRQRFHFLQNYCGSCYYHYPAVLLCLAPAFNSITIRYNDHYVNGLNDSIAVVVTIFR